LTERGAQRVWFDDFIVTSLRIWDATRTGITVKLG
jgi:hypothetical protein